MLQWGKLGCKLEDCRQGNHSEMELGWETVSEWVLA
jgi:hypothetical protein